MSCGATNGRRDRVAECVMQRGLVRRVVEKDGLVEGGVGTTRDVLTARWPFQALLGPIAVLDTTHWQRGPAVKLLSAKPPARSGTGR